MVSRLPGIIILMDKHMVEAQCFINTISSFKCDVFQNYSIFTLILGKVDWIAKRGTYWHVAVCLMKHEDAFMTVTYLHIFDGPISQDPRYWRIYTKM